MSEKVSSTVNIDRAVDAYVRAARARRAVLKAERDLRVALAGLAEEDLPRYFEATEKYSSWYDEETYSCYARG